MSDSAIPQTVARKAGMGCHALLQGLFPTQRSNPGLLHWGADSLLSEPPGKPMNTRVGSPSLLQGIFLTQEWNRGLLNCRWILEPSPIPASSTPASGVDPLSSNSLVSVGSSFSSDEDAQLPHWPAFLESKSPSPRPWLLPNSELSIYQGDLL